MFHLVLHWSGDTVHVVIEARDEYNQQRIVGGDFWFATLQNDKSPKPSAGVAGKVRANSQIPVLGRPETILQETQQILDLPIRTSVHIKG